MQPNVTIAEFDALTPIQWGWLVGVANQGTTTHYGLWWIQHRPIPLTDPIFLIKAQRIRHSRIPKGRGRGWGRDGGQRYGGQGGRGRGQIDLILAMAE